MVIVGVDAHKSTHTLVAVDEVGRKLGERTVVATSEGHLDALEWAERWTERRFALEDCRHVTRRLESDLLAAGQAVMRVPTRLMAGERRGGRERGKSDPIDALAVARAALREPDLPVAQLDGESRQLRLLVDHREDLVRERTRIQCRLRWHLHELFPGLVIPRKALRRLQVLDELDRRLADVSGTVAAIARELISGSRELTIRANQLEAEIKVIVRRLAPALLGLPGCGVLSAAKIVGETAGAARFRSNAAFARWNGTAPIPVSSGQTDHQRLNRGGNRQVNAALHRIAVTQWRGVGTIGRAYVERRIASGDTKAEALRMLRRRLSDEVFRRLLVDEEFLAADESTTAAQAA
ncbi:MAG: IS110 family transposase [Actinomycetota bacterium]|nr:IS110 family transposase [Actinomycetota bacterium]